MSRIKQQLAKLQAEKRRALVPYIVAGDPNRSVTVPFMHKLVEQGADIIELGVPFSDPMAEGPVIQRAHERALEEHVSLRDTLQMVTEFRGDNSATPVVLMGYLNPVEAMGYAEFAAAAQAAGVDGVLTVDLPPEEANELNGELKKQALDTIFLIAPTTTPARIEQIAALATGYIYYVSLKGVTGAANLDSSTVAASVNAIKTHADIPICVGFGIKDAVTAREIARVADGVVVGSALVELMGHGDAGLYQAEALLEEIRSAINTER
ncbi:MAG: tryptophan synthase subunit alpha [Pseudomonadales bacterium]